MWNYLQPNLKIKASLRLTILLTDFSSPQGEARKGKENLHFLVHYPALLPHLSTVKDARGTHFTGLAFPLPGLAALGLCEFTEESLNLGPEEEMQIIQSSNKKREGGETTWGFQAVKSHAKYCVPLLSFSPFPILHLFFFSVLCPLSTLSFLFPCCVFQLSR